MLYRQIITILLLFPFAFNANSQSKSLPPNEIILQLKKLNTLGSVLYVAAHPDDENTRMIAYFANEKCMRAAYLSLTRGDGGQNLIGPEKAEKMGLIRTQELLEARKIDGGVQFFSRANDFGYSKHPDETLKIWGKDEILSDVVWVIRKFRPDIIITRFSPESAGQTHGHHTTSAILAKEAFALAADKNAYSEQLEYVDVWQAKRIYWNTSWWFYGTRDFDKSGLSIVDVGEYNTLLGKNYGEIAGESRSMHKSQGFGASESKGSIEEYLDPMDAKPASENVLEGINSDWRRVKGGESVKVHVDKAISEFDPENPEKIVPHLISAKSAISKIKDDFWRSIKLNEIDEIIFNCLGLSFEALSDEYYYAPGDSMSFNLEVINRSNSEVSIDKISLKGNGFEKDLPLSLKYNELIEKSFKLKIPGEAKISNPYWLREEHPYGRYIVKDQKLRGLPENSPDLQLYVNFKIGENEFQKSVPFKYRWVDRVKGELYRDMVITPPVTTNFLENALLFGSVTSKKLKLSVRTSQNISAATLKINSPKGWTITPSKVELENLEKGATKIIEVQVKPGKSPENGNLTASISLDGKEYSKSFEEIGYDHIKPINFFPEAKMPIVFVDLQKKGDLIGYIKGAGDDVPEALMQMGYQVEFVDENTIIQSDLSKYDAIILGVRAFNTQDWLYNVKERIMKYIYNGGNVILQYNTSRGLDFEKMGPYKFELGRDRVTVEEAEIVVKVSDHPILNTPNKITSADFDNWVQERGLYFASSWSDNFVAPLESNDPGENPSSGMLITAKYGEGYFTYTGISFFRQLPAGVPGAYRLFANLISLGK